MLGLLFRRSLKRPKKTSWKRPTNDVEIPRLEQLCASGWHLCPRQHLYVGHLGGVTDDNLLTFFRRRVVDRQEDFDVVLF